MQENSNSGKTVTAGELAKIIQNSGYGEYDQYHEWSPCYSVRDKSAMLRSMLDNWQVTEPAGRKLIAQFIRALVRESGIDSYYITDVLVSFTHMPEISAVVNEFLVSGVFCRNLLVSMKNSGLRQEDWLIKIRESCSKRKFIEKKREVKLKNLYSDVEFLLEEQF